MNQSDQSTARYELSGGGVVTVLKPFGSSVYGAVVHMAGRYPDPGQVAHNVARDEYIFVLDGEFEITLNGRKSRLLTNSEILVSANSSYFIEGAGRCLVLVKDGQGGNTELRPA